LASYIPDKNDSRNRNTGVREKYSHSKKKLEVRKSEKLAAALSVFDSSCEVEVTLVLN
jgi:hypothetical protein